MRWWGGTRRLAFLGLGLLGLAIATTSACSSETSAPEDGRPLSLADHRVDVLDCEQQGTTATASGAVINDSRSEFPAVRVEVRFLDGPAELATASTEIVALKVDELARWSVTVAVPEAEDLICEERAAVYLASASG